MKRLVIVVCLLALGSIGWSRQPADPYVACTAKAASDCTIGNPWLGGKIDEACRAPKVAKCICQYRSDLAGTGSASDINCELLAS